jgi:hypothetical protein
MVAVITQAQTKMDFDDFRLPIEVIKQKQTEYLVSHFSFMLYMNKLLVLTTGNRFIFFLRLCL